MQREKNKFKDLGSFEKYNDYHIPKKAFFRDNLNENENIPSKIIKKDHLLSDIIYPNEKIKSK